MDADQRAERMSERAAEEFARLDADGDGMISLEEFEAGTRRGSRAASSTACRKTSAPPTR
jgi:Ca2+-binding EF-hand superfamily protein